MRRVGTVLQHVAGSQRAAPPQTAEAPPRLLNDSEMVEFIKNGFIFLPLDELSPDFHAQAATQILGLWEKQGRNNNFVGNNVYPAVPQLGAVLRTSAVRGAITSVLGADYVNHAHRALHISGNNDQGFHKDTPEGGGPVRHMRPRWCMVMYYPAGSTLEMGPTAILPGGQYFSVDNDKWSQVAESMGAKLGLQEFKVTSPLAKGCAILIREWRLLHGSRVARIRQ